MNSQSGSENILKLFLTNDTPRAKNMQILNCIKSNLNVLKSAGFIIDVASIPPKKYKMLNNCGITKLPAFIVGQDKIYGIQNIINYINFLVDKGKSHISNASLKSHIPNDEESTYNSLFSELLNGNDELDEDMSPDMIRKKMEQDEAERKERQNELIKNSKAQYGQIKPIDSQIGNKDYASPAGIIKNYTGHTTSPAEFGEKPEEMSSYMEDVLMGRNDAPEPKAYR